MQPPPFHRAYRYVELPAVSVGRNVLFALAPALLLVTFARQIIGAHARLVTALLAWVGVPVRTRAAALGSITFNLPVLDSAVPAALDSAILAVAGVVIAAVALLSGSRITPAKVLIGIVALICATSGFFFWFFPQRFPYSAADFAGAWCRAEFIVWMVIPLLFAVTLSSLPLSAAATLMFSVETVLYAIWFSAVRLTVLLVLFNAGGLIWMAPAYFACGFLIDFLYIVAYYSLAVARASRSLSRNRDPWRW